MATMKLVAEMSGVSITTVSHVINNTRVVSKDVRDRVESVIQQLNYVPSAIARSLKNDRSNTIGMMIPNNSNPYFAEVIQGVEDASFEQGFNIILCNAYDDPEKQLEYIRVLMSKRIDGLILVSSGTDESLAKLLAEVNVPKVLVDREVAGVSADFIEADHEQGAYLATRYLIELGHREIACVSGPQELLPCQDRISGYHRALHEAGLTEKPEYLIYSDFTSQGGYAAFEQMLHLPNRPSAIFASNDLMAFGGICAAHAAGIRIPDQLSVVGYDDIALASFCTPPLTTVAQPKYEIGSVTAKTLIERIVNSDMPWKRDKLETQLVVRQSTAPYKS